MTSTSSEKRLSVDVSGLVDQIRPYTPQANRQAFREAQLSSFTSTTPTIFSSPLPPASNRGKPTAEEAAKALLEEDPFLNLRSPTLLKQTELDGRPHRQIINIKAPTPFLDKREQQDRVSASFPVRAPSAAMAFSPVIPRPSTDVHPPTEVLQLTTLSSTSYPSANSHDDAKTPVSAAKPPRPPVPPLQNLHSPSDLRPQALPSTPFSSNIPLTYSAVKTPGAAPLNYLGETPASARQPNDPSSIMEFFRSRSARISSPIFSAKKKIDCDDLGSPEVQVNPLAETIAEARAIPSGLPSEMVVRMDFSQTYGFDRAEEVDLSFRANRVPILYSIVVNTTDFDGDIIPEFAKLERDSDSPHTMLVDVVTDRVHFTNAKDCGNSDDGDYDNRIQQATLTFWAAPDAFIQYGCAVLLLTVTDTEGAEHETKVELHVIGTEPIIAVEARENDPEPERKETTVVFANSGTAAEESIIIWNKTLGGAPLLINALVTDSASDAFTIRGEKGYVSDCIPMMIPSGQSYTFTASFEISPNVTLRGRYYGCVLIKLATLTPSRGRHTNSDIELHQFYDHVLNFEAHIPGVTAVDPLSTIEDLSSNNVNEMLYEHRHENGEDIDAAEQQYDPVFDQNDEYVGDAAGYDRKSVTAEEATIKRLSLVVSPDQREQLPDGYADKRYVVCDFNLRHPPCWVSEDQEIADPQNDGLIRSQDEEMNECNGELEGKGKRDYRLPNQEIDQTEDQSGLQYSDESYEEWKRTLEDETAIVQNDIGCFDNPRTVKPDLGIYDRPAEDLRSSEDNFERPEVTEHSARHENIENDERVSFPPQVQLQSYIEGGTDSQSPYTVQNGEIGTPEEAKEKEAETSTVLPTTCLPSNDGSGYNAGGSAPKLANKNARTPSDASNIRRSSDEVLTANQESSQLHPETVEQERSNPVGKAPFMVMIPEETTGRVRSLSPSSEDERTLQSSSAKKPGTCLLDDPMDDVHRKTKQNLKSLLESVGAAVEGVRLDQGFLKPYTKFDSNFNMSEEMNGIGSMRGSVSSVGSLATMKQQQRHTLRHLASRWGGQKGNDARFRPKLRIPRKILEKGLSIAADSGSTSLTVCNGSMSTLRVDIAAKSGIRNKARISVQPQFLALRPEQKAVIRLTRLESEESKLFILLACSTLDGLQTPPCTYRLPVAIKAAKNRVPTVQGFAVDRPTLTYYNPKSTARHCRVRVLNGTKRKVSYKVRIGENKFPSMYDASPFKILSHADGKVEPQKCFSVIVVFDALGDIDYFHDKLIISVGRKTDSIPLFGYSGSSNIQLSRSKEGHLRAHNTGYRYGFLVLSGPEVDSPDNALIRTVLAPGATRDFELPYGSGTIMYTGDEIARTRFCRSHALVENGDNEDNGLFLGHFEGQEQAGEEEKLFWEKEDKHTLHYAGRLMDNRTRRFMFDPNTDKIVLFADQNREMDMSWHASMDGSKFVHIENYDPKLELAFTAFGTEPNAGAIPPLGDAILAAFGDNVQIFARGQSRVLSCDG